MFVVMLILLLVAVVILLLIRNNNYRKNVRVRTYKIIRNVCFVIALIAIIYIVYMFYHNIQDGQGDGNAYNPVKLVTMKNESQDELLSKVIICGDDITVNGKGCATIQEAYSMLNECSQTAKKFQLIDDYATEVTYSEIKSYLIDELGINKDLIEELQEEETE